MEVSLYEYMVPEPFVIDAATPITKVVQLFRQMHLRHLPVIDKDHKLVGMITRKDIFAYTDFFLKNRILKQALLEQKIRNDSTLS